MSVNYLETWFSSLDRRIADSRVLDPSETLSALQADISAFVSEKLDEVIDVEEEYMAFCNVNTPTSASSALRPPRKVTYSTTNFQVPDFHTSFITHEVDLLASLWAQAQMSRIFHGLCEIKSEISQISTIPSTPRDSGEFWWLCDRKYPAASDNFPTVCYGDCGREDISMFCEITGNWFCEDCFSENPVPLPFALFDRGKIEFVFVAKVVEHGLRELFARREFAIDRFHSYVADKLKKVHWLRQSINNAEFNAAAMRFAVDLSGIAEFLLDRRNAPILYSINDVVNAEKIFKQLARVHAQVLRASEAEAEELSVTCSVCDSKYPALVSFSPHSVDCQSCRHRYHRKCWRFAADISGCPGCFTK